MNMKSLLLATVLVMATTAAHAFSFENYYGSRSKTFAGPITLISDERRGTFSEISFTDTYAKVILDSQEDAVAFVASNGEVRGGQLSQALQVIRELAPDLTGSDMELAISIINAAY